MLVQPGRVSVYCFLLPLSSLFGFFLRYIGLEDFEIFFLDNIFQVLAGHFVVVNLLVAIFLRGFLYQVGVRAVILGTVFTNGIFLSVLGPPSYTIFGWYMCILSFFHYSEFLAIAICNPNTLSIDSYILDHSLDYKIAAVASWIEFFIERWLFEGLKLHRIVPVIGLILCIGGEILRKTAMITASSNFTHTVMSKKTEGHTLVTGGVYSFFRHPSYVGWFYWSVGTQLILLNPLCIIAYILASWKFFNDRITIEEFTLLNFFDYQYLDYQKRVPTGLPFIKGYKLSD